MKSDGVGLLEVDALDDIDLARRRPFIGVGSPERRPGAADLLWHMGDVGDD